MNLNGEWYSDDGVNSIEIFFHDYPKKYQWYRYDQQSGGKKVFEWTNVQG